MKHLNKLFLGLGLSAVVGTGLTGCADETFPTDSATQEQVNNSASALEGALNGVTAYMNNASTSWFDYGHFTFAYGAMMVIRDLQTADAPRAESRYDNFKRWEENRYLGDGYIYMQYIWNYYYALVNTANVVVGGADMETASDEQKGYLGAGYAFRAMAYLDLARCYEYLPCVGTEALSTEGNPIDSLTVPIVIEGMTEEALRNNPRAHRKVMKAFIEDDLNKAEELIPFLEDRAGGTRPDLACVYGLKARLYMWVEDYPKAEEYARKAIDAAAVNPMNEDDCLNTTTGFNDITKWMWGSTLTSEDGLVQTGIINWTSWMSNQTLYGYTSPDPGMPFAMIDRNMYERISDTDFRKYEFKAPAGSFLAEKNRYIDGIKAECQQTLPDYTALKFRPAQGNYDTPSIASASSYPLMRVEEMYFIEAEAAAHQEPDRGKQLLESFMKTYRDPEYVCYVDSKEEVVEETVFQKRVELWGEGQSFFDIKRLDYGVLRGYPGTNFYAGTRYNTLHRPAWMNYCIIRTEANNNAAVRGYNNPDPSDTIDEWSE